MSKYYEVVDISQKPDKAGSYVLVSKANTYALNRWDGKVWWDNPIIYTHWLRPLDHLPLSREQAEKVWDAAVDFTEDRIVYRGDRSMFPNTANKEEYLKQFDKQ